MAISETMFDNRWDTFFKIYFMHMQYRKHGLQISQERLQCNLMTNSMKFMQQMTSALSEGYSSVCN